MNFLTISILGNKIFPEIINELKLFSKFRIKYYDDLNLCIKDGAKHIQLIIFFITETNRKDYEKIEEHNFPLIVITKASTSQNILSRKFTEQLNMPFSIIDLEKMIVSLLAKYEFKKSSLINLHDYIIDKNERKIKKNGLELQLTEKEINFLILFSQSTKPLSRTFVLNSIWNYSSESDTHTVETHIHRLRKKILERFNDNNFIKNNDEGYYI